MGWLADQSNASLGSNPGDRVSFFLRQKMKRIHSEQKDCSSRNTIWPKKIITKIRIRTNFFNLFILWKSWFPPKKFCNIDYRSSFPLLLHEQASSDSSASRSRIVSSFSILIWEKVVICARNSFSSRSVIFWQMDVCCFCDSYTTLRDSARLEACGKYWQLRPLIIVTASSVSLGCLETSSMSRPAENGLLPEPPEWFCPGDKFCLSSVASSKGCLEAENCPPKNEAWPRRDMCALIRSFRRPENSIARWQVQSFHLLVGVGHLCVGYGVGHGMDAKE